MENLANTTNTLLSIGTILVEALTLLVFIMILTKDAGPLARWFGKKALPLVTIAAAGSMVASLFYSEVIGYLPCLMCWYQRIALYGIAIMGSVAIVKKTSQDVWNYISIFGILGSIVALFHVFSRSANVEVFDCSAVGPSCLQELFTKFGYIDIPVMSLSALLFILAVAWNRKRFI